MQLSLGDVLTAFRGSLGLNLKILQETYQVRSLEVEPEPASLLYRQDNLGTPIPLHLPLDRIIGQSALINKQWDRIKQDFLVNILRDGASDVTLIDVGSNIGLFTRQCLNRVKAIKAAYCYEPNPSNFRLLNRNLHGIETIRFNNYGLSDQPGSLDFYLDPNNAGNCSLNKAAMPEQHSVIQVDIRAGLGESQRWLAENDGEFLYKSDTQGFDETISTSLDFEFWKRTKAGIFELWRLPGKKEYDVGQFVRILDFFPNKVFEKSPNANISSREVLAYLDGTDMQYDDLYFWK